MEEPLPSNLMDANACKDSLSGLPSAILSKVLLSMGPKDLLKLGCSSKAWQKNISSEELWQQKCEELNCGPFEEGWFHGYTTYHRTRCVECRKPTRYIFKILGCRLCERCEHQHQKYALVTLCEATEKYDRTALELKSLPVVETCGTNMYLRLHVEKLGKQTLKSSEAPMASASPFRRSVGLADSSESEDSDGQEADECEEDWSFDLNMSEDEETAAARAALKKKAAKAVRKANKKQAKLEQRLKREAKAAGGKSPANFASCRSLSSASAVSTSVYRRGSHTSESQISRYEVEGAASFDQVQKVYGNLYSMGSSPPPVGNFQPASLGSSPPGSLHRSPAASFGSRGNMLGGSSMGRYMSDVSPPSWTEGASEGQKGSSKNKQRDRKKLRHRDARDAQASTSRGGKRTNGMGWAPDDHEGTCPLEGMLGSSPKMKSGYMLERERLLEAWGVFGISGLVLASDKQG